MKLSIAGLAMLLVAAAVPASAQQPPVVIGGGVVNVQIIDVIDDVEVVVQDINVNVNAAVRIAANLCGLAVGVIAEVGHKITRPGGPSSGGRSSYRPRVCDPCRRPTGPRGCRGEVD